MAKTATPKDEQLEKQDFDVFEAIAAIDKKDYGYYDRLSDEQKKKFTPYMLILWASNVKGNRDLQNYYVQSVNHYANKYFLDENITKHPKLQWLMLCAASPGMGKQFHQYIPQIKEKVSKLKEQAKHKDIKDYYKKVYPKTEDDVINEIATLFVNQQHKKYRVGSIYPNMKLQDIEVLSDFVTETELADYEDQLGYE